MLAVFILIFILLIPIGAYAFSRRNRNSLNEYKASVLPAQGSFAGLFEEQNTAQNAEQDKELHATRRRADLLERARCFDLQTLEESQADEELYQELLNDLTEQCANSQEKLQRLVSHLSISQRLRSNARLAEVMIEVWTNSPDNKSTAQMLHIVALSDDAALLQQAAEMIFDSWKKGLLPRLSAKDFLALVESEYWVLAPEARRSGAGFILKNSLAELRRRLAATKCG
jgi:hypothetical protein